MRVYQLEYLIFMWFSSFEAYFFFPSRELLVVVIFEWLTQTSHAVISFINYNVSFTIFVAKDFDIGVQNLDNNYYHRRQLYVVH